MLIWNYSQFNEEKWNVAETPNRADLFKLGGNSGWICICMVWHGQIFKTWKSICDMLPCPSAGFIVHWFCCPCVHSNEVFWNSLLKACWALLIRKWSLTVSYLCPSAVVLSPLGTVVSANSSCYKEDNRKLSAVLARRTQQKLYCYKENEPEWLCPAALRWTDLENGNWECDRKTVGKKGGMDSQFSVTPCHCSPVT